MTTRRRFLATTGAGLLGAPLAWATEPHPGTRKKIAIITTVWRYQSHAQHMGDRFLVGYPLNGQWHEPAVDVAAMYVDQVPPDDLSRQRAEEFGCRIYSTIAEALRCGGDRMAVDGVLIIGEHGDYPRNGLGQVLYPRYAFFQQVADVFEQDDRAAAVFNDKHLSWKWEWARAMVDRARTLQFPFMAGSSLPVTWRMPAVDMPWECPAQEVMCVAFGGIDSYDFHALEVIQCMAERRRGGETGVAWVEALRGDSVWKAMQTDGWEQGGWDRSLMASCLARSHTLAPAHKSFSHRRPTDAQVRQMVADPVAFRFQYSDGLRATMLLLNGLVGDFTFAARIGGRAEPLSTLFFLPPTPNVHYSAILMSKVEQMFVDGAAGYPVERTLLTTGVLAAAMQSLAEGSRQVPTPHLEIVYKTDQQSTFCRT